MATISDTSADPPATPAAIELAQQAVREFHECFWWWNDNFVPRTRSDISEVITALRQSGGRSAWHAAQEIVKCL
jgi:hypothetical protein